MLTIEVPDELAAPLTDQASRRGTTPQALALDHLRALVAPLTSEGEARAARERFERHFGAVDLGHPTGVDNEAIDADLAREYDGNADAP